jgi:hypothetical protein
VLQVWLQEFAWTEEERESQLRQRASSLRAGSDAHAAAELAHEPLFCFETALKMFFWSNVVYDHLEVRGASLRKWDISGPIWHGR